MKNVFWLILLTFSGVVNAQVATSDPALPIDTDSVRVVFDVSKASGNLSGYSGDVYVHTGVLTEKSSTTGDWKYVQTDWGENTPETKLDRIGTDLYEFRIKPDIRQYYGVPEGEKITHLAFVLRSGEPAAGGNYYEAKEEGGKDIFIEVFEEGLDISIIVPSDNVLADINTTQPLEAAASETAEINLFLNDELVSSLTGNEITYTFNFDSPGDYRIKVTAQTTEEFAADSVFIHILGEGVTESLPPGMKRGFNETGPESGILVLYAPGKEHAFVLGDFNQFTPAGEYRMKQDDGYFWLELNNLEPGKEYAYQYLVDGETKIADPYTEKVLDPWNDRYISDETYPDLKEYPYVYTDGIVSVLQTEEEEYQWSGIDFQPPEEKKLVIYELLLRDFIAAHDWETLTDTLNYFTDLGINAIELMPVNEFEGNESWGYNPSFYFAPDKYYGPASDLKEFIDSCHNRDIAVIIDMVLNHSYGQSPLVQLYWNETLNRPSADNPWYNEVSPNPVYSWGYDFDHQSTATKNFVDSVNSFWLTEYKVDGFRFDFTKGFTNTPGEGWNYDPMRISILKRMADEIRKVDPDAYIILEHFAENTEEEVLSNYGLMLWGNYNYNYNEATMGWNENGKSDFSGISYLDRGWGDPHLVGFMESHDEERLMYKNLMYGNSSGDYDITELATALRRIELAAAFFFTIPGPKMIWQFGEVGYDYSIDYNGRVGNKPIRWDYYNSRHRVYEVFSALINLRVSEPAFSTDNFVVDAATAVKKIRLNHQDMDVRIIGNFDVVNREGTPGFSRPGTWYDYFSGESLEVTDTEMQVDLDPGEYHIYTTKELSTPDLPTSRKDRTTGQAGLYIYPNPANDVFYVESRHDDSRLVMLDLSGRIVRTDRLERGENRIGLSGIPGGMYILRVEEESGGVKVGKIVVE